ncbi:MAG: cation:proton antiporter [Planctomycetota bacterium]
MDDLAAGLSAIVLLGAGAQWLGWRLRLPSILILLLFGFLAGPEVAGLVDPDRMFGALLLPVISLSVAILLFEGALTLHWRELGEHRGVVGRLITLGAGITWLLAALAAHLLVGLEGALAVLVGAILTVTGPTVVLPLLRQVRPTGSAGSILKWEGILIDPVGAVLAVLVFEGILEGGLRPAVHLAALGILKTALIGGAIGLLGAWVLVLLLERYWVPDHLHNPAALSLAVGAYAATNYFQHEGGLLTVTVMGVLLANQKRVDVKHILEFKENLRVLIISMIFILLAARLRLADLAGLPAGVYLFLAVLILVVRPLSVLACTARTNLRRETRIFIAAMAPRGVVAAAVTAVFALSLEDKGFADARRLVPLIFLVVCGTVAIYGLTAGPLAYRLKLATPSPQGVLIVGAHRFARALGEVLQAHGLRVRLVDTNAFYISRARMLGLPVYHGSAFSEQADEALDLAGLGRLFAITSNDEVNTLCVLHFLHLFGRGEVYQIAPRADTLPRRLRGRVLFGEEWSFPELDEWFASGATVKATKLTEQFGFEQWRARHGDRALPLLAIDGDGRVDVATLDQLLAPEAGETLVALVEKESAPK